MTAAAAGADSKSVLVKSYVKYPRTVEELGVTVRELMSEYDIEEIMIRPGEPVMFVYRADEGEEGESVDVTPYDLVRMSPMEEVREYPEDATPFALVEILLHGLTSRGSWPLCLVVNDTATFLKSLGFSDDYIRRVQPPAFLGYPVVQDSRVADGVVIAAATPTQRDGYGRINFSLFAHID